MQSAASQNIPDHRILCYYGQGRTCPTPPQGARACHFSVTLVLLCVKNFVFTKDAVMNS